MEGGREGGRGEGESVCRDDGISKLCHGHPLGEGGGAVTGEGRREGGREGGKG